MKQNLFERQHRAAWKAFVEQLERLERGKADARACESFSADYRQICQQLALAQERGYSSHLVEHLQQLAMRGHQQFYRHRSHLGARLLGFLLGGFPRLVRSQWRSIAAASLLFYGSLLLMGLLVHNWPDLVYSVLDPEQVSSMESMYDPDARRIGPMSERDAGDDWMMFGHYIMNNIGIAFQTYAGGLLFGFTDLLQQMYNLSGPAAGVFFGCCVKPGFEFTWKSHCEIIIVTHFYSIL